MYKASFGWRWGARRDRSSEKEEDAGDKAETGSKDSF
jgi:hypothetical protein